MHPLLAFTADYLSARNFRTTVFNIYEDIGDAVDLGLRHMLFTDIHERIIGFEGIEPDFISRHIIYFTTDRYGCRYIIIPMPEETGDVFFIGPYLSEIPSIYRTRELVRNLGIPPVFTDALNQYFSTLPHMEYTVWIEQYMDSLGRSLYGAGNFSLRYLVQKTSDSAPYLRREEMQSNQDTYRLLEERYIIENRLMTAISAGNISEAVRLNQSEVFSALENRTPNPLRSRKNYMIILNTLCRKAAERGAVHPIYLDELSRTFAVRIEQVTHLEEITPLSRDIVRHYCMLVQRESTGQYSPTVRSAANYISLHLTEPDLALAKMAEALTLNKTYLAAQFKKETGQTVTESIHARRIDMAILLLNSSDMSIQDIASACGMPDLGYFSRIFRRLKNLSPTAYRQMLRETVSHPTR